MDLHQLARKLELLDLHVRDMRVCTPDAVPIGTIRTVTCSGDVVVDWSGPCRLSADAIITLKSQDRAFARSWPYGHEAIEQEVSDVRVDGSFLFIDVGPNKSLSQASEAEHQ